jgi:hypothetical protein
MGGLPINIGKYLTIYLITNYLFQNGAKNQEISTQKLQEDLIEKIVEKDERIDGIEMT